MVQTRTIKDFSKVYDVYITRMVNGLEEPMSKTVNDLCQVLVRQVQPIILTLYTEISTNTSPEYKIVVDTTNADVRYNRAVFTQECSFGRFLFEQYFSNDCMSSSVTTAIDSYGSIPNSICEVSTKNLNDIAIAYNDNNDKEKTMNNFINFDFGPCTKDNVRMSGYGLAVKNPAGNWVSYDKASGAIIDVSVLNFDASDFFYKIPAAISDVAVGDMIIHNRKPMYITETKEKTFCAIDVVNSEIVEIIPTRNMFGFDFVTKVVSLIDMMGGVSATDSSPFGNMLPFLMMGGDNDNLLPLMIMSQGNESINPMMMYCLMKNGNNDSSNLLPLMFMMNNNRGATNN